MGTKTCSSNQDSGALAGGARATNGEGTKTDESSTPVGVLLYKRLFRQMLHDVGLLYSG
jgi:hypothetical protein